MPRPFPIGISDFRELRETDLEYVDKSFLIQRVLDDGGSKAILLPRPRRFGKTLNLTMLRCYFEKRDEDFSHLFKGLQIWEAGDTYRAHFQRYPVIYLTFKDLKPTSIEDWKGGLKLLLGDLARPYRYLLSAGGLDDTENEQLNALLNCKDDASVQKQSLKSLTTWLHRLHGEKVVVLIDEYDTPIQSAFLGGFADEVLNFFRIFLGAGLKDNPALFKSVITGILRVAKENLFSGLNNLSSYGLLRAEYADAFGFTEEELLELLQRVGQAEHLPLIRQWYNGYLFGERVIYNPWSVLNFLKNPDKHPQPYWLNTSANDLVREMLLRHALHLEDDIQRLMQGESIEKPLEESVVLTQVLDDPLHFWSLMVFSGYLKASTLPELVQNDIHYRLAIPNLEVRKIFFSTFQQWMRDALPGRHRDVDLLLRSLFTGDVQEIQALLNDFAHAILSFHDPAARHPESIYQGFILGLCAVLESTHRVRSNSESGTGRADVLIVPRKPGKAGVVIELKAARTGRKTVKQALIEGRAQLASRDYASELREAGASPLHAYVMAFSGKAVKVEAVTLNG